MCTVRAYRGELHHATAHYSSCADLHVWSLSESKIVASVHIMVKGPDLVKVSKEIKRRFHRFGIHAS